LRGYTLPKLLLTNQAGGLAVLSSSAPSLGGFGVGSSTNR